MRLRSADAAGTTRGETIDAPERAAAGESQKPDKGTGKMSLHAPTNAEPEEFTADKRLPEGSVFDLWDALKTIAERSGCITRICFYTLDGGLEFRDVPRLNTLRRYKDEDALFMGDETVQIMSDVYRWVYVRSPRAQGHLGRSDPHV